jgi:SAM-dependent methyltransferase
MSGAEAPLDPASLACPVRGCGSALALEHRALRCEGGHAFDLTKRGAVNLLQPQDRRAREPGDARAIDLAARAHPALTWVVANADRRLPLRDAIFDLVLSVTGPRPERELRRVLRPGGLLAAAVPAPDDLIELRAAVFGEGHASDRVAQTLEALGEGFVLERRLEVRHRVRLDPDAQRDLLASTHRAGRRSRVERAA